MEYFIDPEGVLDKNLIKSFDEEYADADNFTITNFINKTIRCIWGSEEALYFGMSDGSIYKMHHHQNCCEYVELIDVVGDLSDIVGTPILRAEERQFEGTEESPALLPPGVELPDIGDIEPESSTYTFYEFATIKGSVTLRWFGRSNGYYSESVDIDSVRLIMCETNKLTN